MAVLNLWPLSSVTVKGKSHNLLPVSILFGLYSLLINNTAGFTIGWSWRETRPLWANIMGCSAGKHMTTSPEVSSSSHSAKENGCTVHTPGNSANNVNNYNNKSANI